MGQIRRDQRRVLQEHERGITIPGCALAIGERSYLRLLDDRDAPELHALIEANRPQLAPWLPWAEGQTSEDTSAFIDRTRTQLAENDGFQAAVICGEAIAGVIGYIRVEWDNRATGLGYWLAEEFQGKGTMTEAARVLVDHALGPWELNRVEIQVAKENRPSRGIPERLGFRQEGTLRRAQRIGSRYVDLVVYSMLAADWARR